MLKDIASELMNDYSGSGCLMYFYPTVIMQSSTKRKIPDSNAPTVKMKCRPKITLRRRITFHDLEVNREAQKMYESDLMGTCIEIPPNSTPYYVEKTETVDPMSPTELDVDFSFL